MAADRSDRPDGRVFGPYYGTPPEKPKPKRRFVARWARRRLIERAYDV